MRKKQFDLGSLIYGQLSIQDIVNIFYDKYNILE